MIPATRHDDQHPADPGIGHDLGWDHGRYGLVPDITLLMTHPAVRDGWIAARNCFGRRTLAAPAQVRQWLDLRTEAWLCGQHFDTVAVMPRYLAQLAVSHCPVTREPLPPPEASGLPNPATIERICADAGYAAGNLATMSRRAAAARTGLGWEDALEQMRRIDARRLSQSAGLNALQWARLAVLLSFVTPLSHERAASLPLLVLPPNRLHLLNPVQGLQALLTMQLLRRGWSQRIPAFEALLPGAALRRDLRAFCSALMPNVLAHRPDTPSAWRYALEDAWRQPRVQQQWRRFALQLDTQQSQQLLEHAVEQGLCAQQARTFSTEEATAGWQPDARGAASASPSREKRPAGMPRPIGTRLNSHHGSVVPVRRYQR